MVVWWGLDLIMLYNDAWQPILGETKHPSGLGRPGRDSWPRLGPLSDSSSNVLGSRIIEALSKQLHAKMGTKRLSPGYAVVLTVPRPTSQ
jgi:hypothetical protein